MRYAQLTALLAMLGLAACSDDTKQATPDSRPADTGGGEKARPDGPVAPTEATGFATYNAGLTASVPYAAERRPLIIDALKQLKADVLCLQEVWSDADAKAVTDGLTASFPFSFREKTEDTSTAKVRCSDTNAVLALKGCYDNKCAPTGIPQSTCVSATGPCKKEYDALTDDCKRCLAANSDNPLVCLAGAKDFVNDGRNGLLLLSRVEIKNPKYTPMDTVLVKRGVITATVGSAQIQCTHLPADLDVVPYPTGRTATSWQTEHAAAVTVLTGTASGSCTVLLGDLNSGPAQSGLTGELADNFKAFATAGYTEPWASPVCTWCKENPLTGGSPDKWIDHVMFKGCAPKAASATYARILDSEVTVKSGGKDVKTRLSDHYGLSSQFK